MVQISGRGVNLVEINSTFMRQLLLLGSAVIAIGCSSGKTEKKETPGDVILYSLQRTFPHDTKAFTQGLVVHNGQLFESTGQENQSWVGVVDINTGLSEKKATLASRFFGEGITILNNKLYQLTWKDKTGFVYDLASFKKLREFSYTTEGWGLTHNNEHLIMSDGSENLYFLDTVNFSVAKKLKVTYQGDPVKMLNELEFVEGFIFANVWQTNSIAKIDVSTGNVVGFMDLGPLASQAALVNPQQDVLNGIAWHAGSKTLLVTGKYWPYLYVLKLTQPSGS